MKKKPAIMAILLLCALVLSACASLNFQNINDLLHAPALARGQDKIQKALEDYLGGIQPQYKYPKEGGWRSPLISADLDGDGREEAMILYSLDAAVAESLEKSEFVYVAVLQYIDEAWQVVYDEQGLQTDVASLQVADLLGNGTKQLIVGYASSNLNSRTLALYTWQESVLNRIYQYDYSRYQIGDFTGRGGNDLVVVSRSDDAGSLMLNYIPTANGQFLLDTPIEPVRLDANFQSCAGIAAGMGRGGQRVLIVDGVNAVENGALSSQIVYYEDGRFYTVDDAGFMRGETPRANPLLKANDIDGDGVVEIPKRWGRSYISTPSGEKNLEYVEWWDYTSRDEPFIKQFGIVDSERSVFIRLPDEWRGQVEVVDYGDLPSEWQLRHKNTSTVLLIMQIVEPGQSPAVGSLRVPGTTSAYLVPQLAVSVEENEFIVMTVLQ